MTKSKLILDNNELYAILQFIDYADDNQDVFPHDDYNNEFMQVLRNKIVELMK
tara:strand:+ start:1340 stop:1498 length:159 start_codon:yes stop_codon:yes gene_type:complete